MPSDPAYQSSAELTQPAHDKSRQDEEEVTGEAEGKVIIEESVTGKMVQDDTVISKLQP